MKTAAARFVNEHILSKFNIRLVRVSSLEDGHANGTRLDAATKPDSVDQHQPTEARKRTHASNEVPTSSGAGADSPPYPAALRQDNVEGARLFADRFELIKSLSHLQGLKVAEVGVAYGDFSRFLIDQLNPQTFHAYDLFRFHEVPLIWGRPPAETLKGLTHKEFYSQRFASEVAAGRLSVFEGDSVANLNERDDALYDIIYIDADHHYSSVLRDANAAIPKLKPGGLLIFNDYILYDHIAHIPYGIVHVVNDLCVNHGWKITHFAFHQHMFCDVAIRRAG